MLGAVRRTFLSTPSARRATQVAFLALPDSRISIHALREEGDGDSSRKIRVAYISIHALREEGDGKLGGAFMGLLDFYPRPPRGGRHTTVSFKTMGDLFLSTPSARRATFFRVKGGYKEINFYPRPPRGGRRRCGLLFPHWRSISIHALREEGDMIERGSTDGLAEFLSTPSARRAT